ncbi:hypothetical protein KIS4809_5113 [Bacillus sp. ZZV12-4809]|nr:hypothetical protein KIS4809_5113 [Bacillus sp. ZZV12-4809]
MGCLSYFIFQKKGVSIKDRISYEQEVFGNLWGKEIKNSGFLRANQLKGSVLFEKVY